MKKSMESIVSYISKCAALIEKVTNDNNNGHLYRPRCPLYTMLMALTITIMLYQKFVRIMLPN